MGTRFLCINRLTALCSFNIVVYTTNKKAYHFIKRKGERMQTEKIHLVYFSPCGGTAAVMKMLAARFAGKCVEHDLTLPASRNTKILFEENDLVFFGFPVYSGRVPKITAQIFAVLEGKNTPCALVAVYGNREYEGALLDLQELAHKAGFNTVAAVTAIAQHSIASQFGADRPDSEDEKLLGDFGAQIFEQAKS